MVGSHWANNYGPTSMATKLGSGCFEQHAKTVPDARMHCNCSNHMSLE